MNARDYMAKHNLAQGKDSAEEHPQSLEEKAWKRALEAAEHGPTSGTPFDWEDWERYHETLGKDAKQVGMKADKKRVKNAPQSDDESAK